MTIAIGDDLPPDASVVLLVGKTKQIFKDGQPDEIDPDAFRCDDDGISVTWVDYFEGHPDECLAKASFAMKGPLSIKKSFILARAKVSDIIDASASAGHEVRVIYDRQDHNHAHALIVGLTKDDLSGLLALTGAFPRAGFVFATDISGLVG